MSSAELWPCNRQLNTQFDVTTSGGARVAGWQYQYGNDGRLSYSHDLRDDRLDRAYTYDHSTQLMQGVSGSEARGDNAYPYTGPYKQTYGFDAWGNLTDRSMRIHGYMGYPTTSYYHDNYANNRNTGGDSQPWVYDADGRLTNDRTRQYSFDAAGHQIYNSQNSIYRTFDGDGELLKKVENWVTTYYLQSSVLGEVITELNQSGQKLRGYVYREGEVLAKQEGGQVLWNHDEPSGTSSQWTNAGATVSSRAEMDPLGTAVDEDGGFTSGSGGFGLSPTGFYGDSSNQGTGCAAGSAGAACSSVLNYSGSLAWQSFLTFGRVETRTGTKQIQVSNPNWKTIWDMRKTVTVQYQYAEYVNLGAFFRNNWLPPVGPVGPDPPQDPVKGHIIDDPQTPCHIMADVAQNEANTALYQNPNDFNAALRQFDRTFSTLYVGGPMINRAEAERLSPGDLRTINPSEPFTGGAGFKDEYKDSGTDATGGPRADQTHHFAAFLSLGINGRWGIYGYRHLWQGDNQGDLNLGQAAFALGTQLKRHGKNSTFKNIGVIIRRKFCKGPGHGLYYN